MSQVFLSPRTFSLLPSPKFLQNVDSSQNDGAAFLVDSYLLFHSRTSSSAVSLKTIHAHYFCSAESPASLPPQAPTPRLQHSPFQHLPASSFHQRNVFLALLQKPFWAFTFSSNKYLSRAYSLLGTK